jgi:hypothetical protein
MKDFDLQQVTKHLIAIACPNATGTVQDTSYMVDTEFRPVDIPSSASDEEEAEHTDGVRIN